MEKFNVMLAMIGSYLLILGIWWVMDKRYEKNPDPKVRWVGFLMSLGLLFGGLAMVFFK